MSDVHANLYALVREIRGQRLPRNRNFEVYQQPLGAEARRVHRFLRGVERDIHAASAVEVARTDAGYTLSLAFPEVRLTRVVALKREEFEIVAEDPALAVRLAG